MGLRRLGPRGFGLGGLGLGRLRLRRLGPRRLGPQGLGLGGPGLHGLGPRGPSFEEPTLRRLRLRGLSPRGLDLRGLGPRGSGPEEPALRGLRLRELSLRGLNLALGGGSLRSWESVGRYPRNPPQPGHYRVRVLSAARTASRSAPAGRLCGNLPSTAAIPHVSVTAENTSPDAIPADNRRNDLCVTAPNARPARTVAPAVKRTWRSIDHVRRPSDSLRGCP